MMKRNRFAIGILLAALLLALPALVAAAPGPNWPELIPLPNGFQPEGVASGRGTTLYAGSRTTGAIYEADARTGEGEILVEAQTGRVALGIQFDNRTGALFVAGGPTGHGYVYDARSGADLADYTLTMTTTTFVNDVAVTNNAAYFTDSFQPVLYVVPLGPGGRLPGNGAVEALPLSGDYQFVPGGFNANGIEATPNGQALIIVNSTTGLLYRVDPVTGEATEIDLGGATLTAGDGLLLQGHTLYVVRNQLNQIAVVQLDPGFTSGAVVGTLTDDDFDIPTTVARIGASLYAVNARFTTPPTPDTEYDIVRLPAH
jgi:sugar lactone lactonase YvrE